jgi:replicative DNA helicase
VADVLSDPGAEQTVLIQMFRSHALAAQAIGFMGRAVDVFSDAQHGRVYRAIVEAQSKHQHWDSNDVAMALRDTGDLKGHGGVEAIYALSKLPSSDSEATLRFHTDHLKDLASRRTLINALRGAARHIKDVGTPFDAALSEAQKSIFNVNERFERRDIATADVLAEETYEYLTNDEPAGASTGFVQLDAVMGGLRKGGLYVIAGRPGMGKSVFAMNIARNVLGSSNGRVPLAVFTLEMTGTELMLRMVSSDTLINARRIQRKLLSGDDLKRVKACLDVLGTTELRVFSHQAPTVAEIRAQCQSILMAEKGLSLIVLDYLQLVAISEDEVRELGQFTRGLKQLAIEFGVPVMLVSQLNRQVESRSDKRPKIWDLKGSGNIEQDADVIMLLYREDYYTKERVTQGTSHVEVDVAKNRAGSDEVVRLDFHLDPLQFTNHGENPVARSDSDGRIPF